MTDTLNSPLDKQLENKLREAILSCFSGLAEGIPSPLRYRTGMSQALRLGYPENELSWIPYQTIDAFAGVGNPLMIEKIESNLTVVDIGSGGGMDVFLLSDRLGSGGKIYGIDMTPGMIDLARSSADKMHAHNVTFLRAPAEALPLPDKFADVVISNGVINLCVDKNGVLREMFRILKPGGRIQVADVTAEKKVLPADADYIKLWTNCLAGAFSKKQYLRSLKDTGFKDIKMFDIHSFFDGSRMQELAEYYGAGVVHLIATRPSVAEKD